MGIIEFAIQEAAQRARVEKNTSVVERLLLKGKLTLEDIADAAEVSLDFVRSVRMQLQ